MRPAALAILLTLLVPPAASAKPPDLSDPDKVVSDMAYGAAGHMGREWWEARKEAVRRDPATYAPFIRERLMRLPATLDEYSVDDPQWVINRPSPGHPGSLVRPLMSILILLPPAQAEPVLQEFFDRVNPLALEAHRRYWAAKDADDPRDRERNDIWTSFARGRSEAIRVAMRMHSPIFIDDVLAMLESDDDAARYTGAVLADQYVLEFAAERPEALARVVAAASELNESANPKLAPAARALTERIRSLVQPEPRDDTRADPAHQRDS
jgi:hypothetical protein